MLLDRPGFELRSVTRPRARYGVVLGLLFLGGPLADLFRADLGRGHRLALLAGTALFVAAYVSLLPPAPWLRRRGPTAMTLVLAALPAIAIALLVGGAPHSYAALFV